MGTALSLPVSMGFRLPAATSFSQSKHCVLVPRGAVSLSWAVRRAASCEAMFTAWRDCLGTGRTFSLNALVCFLCAAFPNSHPLGVQKGYQ